MENCLLGLMNYYWFPSGTKGRWSECLDLSGLSEVSGGFVGLMEVNV